MISSESPFERLQHVLAINKTFFIALFLGMFACILLLIKYTDPNRVHRVPTMHTEQNSKDEYGHVVPMMQNIGRHSH